MAPTGPEASVICRPGLVKARETLVKDRFDLLILSEALVQIGTVGDARFKPDGRVFRLSAYLGV